MAKGKQASYLNYGQIAVDTMTIFFGLASMIMAIIVFVDFTENLIWTPLIFLLSGCMSGTIGLKNIFRREKVKAAVHFVQFILLIGVAVLVWFGTR